MKLYCKLLLLLLIVPALYGQSLGGGLFDPTNSPRSVTFANLGTPLNGHWRYCTDCAATSPCTGSGSGAFAYRVGGAWNCNIGSAGSGDVVGPASSTADAITLFSGTTGKLLKNSAVTIDATGNITLPQDKTILIPGVTSGDLISYGHGASGPRWSDADAGNAWGMLSLGSLTADRTFTLPNATGTLALTSSNVASATALAADPTGCTNQFVTDIAANGTPTCTTVTLAGDQFANQGTTTTVLHGNAAGNPSFGKVVDGDITFTAPVLGAPTATTMQTSGNVGFGAAPSGTGGQMITAQSSANATTSIRVLNTTGTASAIATVQAISDTAIVSFSAFPSAFASSLFGQTLASWSVLSNGATGSGLVVGTTSATPLILGANSLAGISINSTGTNVSFPQRTVTAGTMTGTYEAVSSMVTTCRSWTNAQVTALPTTAGDITWGTLPAKTIVRNAYIVITGAAAGPATVTVALGRTSATYIDYIVASDAKAAANTVYGDASGERGTNLTGYDLPSYTGTTVVNAHFISTGANLSTVTGSTGLVCIATDALP